MSWGLFQTVPGPLRGRYRQPRPGFAFARRPRHNEGSGFRPDKVRTHGLPNMNHPARRQLLVALAGLLVILGPMAIQAAGRQDPVKETAVVQAELATTDGVVAVRTFKNMNGEIIQLPLAADAAVPEGMEEVTDVATPPATPEGEAAATPEGAAEGAAAEATAAPATGSVKRSDRPKVEADPDEFKARPGEDGKIEFQFKGQAWPELLEWLAEVSSMSLDWQELPDDTLNLSTQRPYTLDEARDLFNRHLLMRGYTLLEFEGMLQVAKVESVNPALVPRVEADQLAGLPPNRFVRTTFLLRSLLADSVIEDLKVLLSKNGKLTALSTSNRLDAMDSASNLLEIACMLEDEQSPEVQAGLAREFTLTWVRAETVKEQLELFLGRRSLPGGNLTQEQVQQVIQQQHELAMTELNARIAADQAAAAAVAAGQPVAPPAKARTSAMSIYANPRRNSLIVNAPPDRMAMIEIFIQRIDVAPADQSIDSLTSRIRVYRLASLDPQKFIDSLRELDALEPGTKLQVDKVNKAVIATASLLDHMVIQQLKDRLDGSARQFDVIQLRKHKAADVAGTIRTMMGLDEKDDSNSRRSYYYWDDEPEEESSKDKFRVGANVRDNQVLVWANDFERGEVNKLLAKLGEMPGEQTANLSRIRTIDASRGPETLEYLQRIQAMWEQGESTPLILPSAGEFESGPAPDPDQPEPDAATPGPLVAPAEDGATTPDTSSRESNTGLRQGMAELRHPSGKFSPAVALVAGPHPASGLGLLAASGRQEPVSAPVRHVDEPETPAAAPSAADGSDDEDAVRIGFDSRGNLVLFSDNLAALDRLERMMAEFKPPRREFEVFHVEHADALWISGKLGTYFRNREPPKENSDPFRFFYYDEMPERETKPDSSLDSRPPLKFLADIDTKSIIVQGADDADLDTIGQLIRLWDVPEPPKQTNVRRTRLIKIRNTKADLLVATVKEVYRDLLSATDSSFQTPPSGEGDKKDSADAPPPPRPFSFSGNISLGVDQVTNTIVVSATGSQSEAIMEMVCGLIDQLDQAARPSGVTEVVRMDLGQRGEHLEKLLRTMLQSKADQLTQPPEQPAQPAAEQPAPEQPPQVAPAVRQQVVPAPDNSSGNSDKIDQ